MLRGEAFQYESLDNRLSVYYEGELIHHQRQLIRPALQRMATQGAWGDYSHLGSFVVFSDRVTPGLLEIVRKALEELPFAQEQLIAGAALTWRHGLSVSASASAAWVLQQTLWDVWAAVRQTLLGLRPSQASRIG
ncbi:urease accessory protein UreD [Cohnella rhizosphaerae]|uniref:Urease accessory protein UreD n=1 Tax=Cohnella rhizosphaerae TaxID=1457232 RepID=A0A9X4QST7_9BACL|nr:urease accessory protein UreD [Cohnella rhizosphaerae]MDG0808932.1 urease accessory protein UreD [Cohnella rhizosphaerae]